MRIVLFTFYYSPDLCAGSFRSKALGEALSNRLCNNDELHIITTQPNRYASYEIAAKNFEDYGRLKIHRITIPKHKNSITSQAKMFIVYSVFAYRICKQINPDFIIGTTSRLMTGVLSGVSGYRLKKKYFIDLRDVFSETISDIFSRRSKALGSVFKIIFLSIEKKLFVNAAGVNIVSEGFLEYFKKEGLDVSSWSFFPNGVDREFRDLIPLKEDKNANLITVLYAGNIGDGQGIEGILPEVALRMKDKCQFLIIGDGGMRTRLEQSLKEKKIDNVRVLSPVKRDNLVEFYKNADILFLHLNSIPAFRRVLPSKIFEYAALGKPIVAGVEGYAAEFIQNNISHASVFDPGDVNQCVDSIRQADLLKVDRREVEFFVEKYSRDHIMKKMTNNILEKI